MADIGDNVIVGVEESEVGDAGVLMLICRPFMSDYSVASDIVVARFTAQ